jgi:hypothetical protein
VISTGDEPSTSASRSRPTRSAPNDRALEAGLVRERLAIVTRTHLTTAPRSRTDRALAKAPTR